MEGLHVKGFLVSMLATQLWLTSGSRKAVQYTGALPDTGSWDPEPLDAFDPTFIAATWSEGDVEDFGAVVQGPQLFEKDNNYARLVAQPATSGKDVETSSVQDEASSLKASANLEASYGFFSGTVQGDIERRLQEYQHFYQTDREVFVQRAKFTRRAFYPPDHLVSGAQQYMTDLEPERIRHVFGDFWVKEVSVGGRLRRRMTMTLNKKVSDTEVFGKISGEMNKVAFKLGAEAEVDVKWSDSSVKSKTTTMFNAAGGNDLTMWFAFNGNNFDELQQEWADAMHAAASESKVYTMVKMKLEPLWTLIKYWNNTKAQELENYYKVKWADDAAKLKEWEEYMSKQTPAPTPAPTQFPPHWNIPRRRRACSLSGPVKYPQQTVTHAKLSGTGTGDRASAECKCNLDSNCRGYRYVRYEGDYHLLVSGSSTFSSNWDWTTYKKK